MRDKRWGSVAVVMAVALGHGGPSARAQEPAVAAAPAPAARETVAWRGGLVFWTKGGPRANLAGKATPTRLVLADPAGERTGDYVPIHARPDDSLVLYVRSDDFATVATRPAMVTTSPKKALAAAKSGKPPAEAAIGVHLEAGAELDILEQKDGAAKVVLRGEPFMVEGWIAESLLAKSYRPAPRAPGERQVAAGSVSLFDKPRGTPILVLGAGDPEVTLLPGKKSKQKGHTLVRVDGGNAHVVGWLVTKDLMGVAEPATPVTREDRYTPLPAGTAVSDRHGGKPVATLGAPQPAFLGTKRDGWQEITLFTLVGKVAAWMKLP